MLALAIGPQVGVEEIFVDSILGERKHLSPGLRVEPFLLRSGANGFRAGFSTLTSTTHIVLIVLIVLVLILPLLALLFLSMAAEVLVVRRTCWTIAGPMAVQDVVG